ncbi:MAG TPA: UDP-N-acetylglucosamine 2-epimerase (non-hydrolyzing) [Ramlibacter sp.]|nr:UDP-N-acetylglucosamine 2-epimerase (non-hydrolyzing) [Ramlibacter sp.]
MKITTILGTRPEIIRLSLVIRLLDQLSTHALVHTGQNFDATLSENVFADLGVRQPDHFLAVGASASMGQQLAQIIEKTHDVLVADRPDRLLVLGDTNSALSAIVAKRLGIPVFHMEAGNRCFDDRVPEEVNRRIIDHSSDVLMPYTERSRQNLLREGIESHRICVTGNPINEVMRHHAPAITASTILSQLGLERGNFFLVTMHRAENVDDPARLQALGTALARLHQHYGLPVIVSTHPRTRARLDAKSADAGDPGVRFLPPFGFMDFVALEQGARCVLSDSGTVQEECCILKVPNVTIRDVTERPETIECGSNILSGVQPDSILRCVATALHRPPAWNAPPEYLATDVSATAARIVLGHQPGSLR